MRKVILQEFVTIDGFAADKKGTTSFFDFIQGEEGKEVDMDLLKFIDTIDIILLGANTYSMFVEFWPSATTKEEIVADKLNAIPKIVFSKSLNKAPWGKWKPAKLVKTDAAEEIIQLKRHNGKNMVLWGSISLAQSLMKEGVIDEYQLRICPVALGEGRPLFPEGISTLNMELLETKAYDNGVVFLRYGLDA